MAAAGPAGASSGPQPVILLDVMDTIVSDPFFDHMPRFFNLTFKELLAAKHPTAWVEFEKDQITQQQLFDKFFADRRQFDGQALIEHMVAHYRYIDGMPELLQRLKQAGYSLHAMSNYPTWYKLIEEKLQLSQYLDWTFVSCTGPMRGLRKPAPAAFEAATSHLQLPPQQLVFVDDRQPNVDAAAQAGMTAILFTDTAALDQKLQQLGLKF
ncbi:HAD-like domain-containing protein [Scenedesmus sp. NREL 46B-D3]|nr:HAD-like domain-containing protein [Scenedesmus sp. NREL 46B-D3]